MGSTIQMLTKQQEVKALYMTGKLTAREISNMADVSETTISDWVNKFKWKDARDFRNKREMLIGELQDIDTDYVLKGFVDYITTKQPYLKIQWEIWIDEYKGYLKSERVTI